MFTGTESVIIQEQYFGWYGVPYWYFPLLPSPPAIINLTVVSRDFSITAPVRHLDGLTVHERDFNIYVEDVDGIT